MKGKGNKTEVGKECLPMQVQVYPHKRKRGREGRKEGKKEGGREGRGRRKEERKERAKAFQTVAQPLEFSSGQWRVLEAKSYIRGAPPPARWTHTMSHRMASLAGSSLRDA